MHSEEVERLHQTSREQLENPTVNDVTATLLDDVEHNHSNQRGLVESPKGSYVHVPHSSSIEHDDVHEVYVELLQVHTYHSVEHDDVESGSPGGPLVVHSVDASLVVPEAVKRSHDGVEIFEQ